MCLLTTLTAIVWLHPFLPAGYPPAPQATAAVHPGGPADLYREYADRNQADGKYLNRRIRFPLAILEQTTVGWKDPRTGRYVRGFYLAVRPGPQDRPAILTDWTPLGAKQCDHLRDFPGWEVEGTCQGRRPNAKLPAGYEVFLSDCQLVPPQK